MAKRAVDIGNRRFESKAKAKDYIRSIIVQYKDGEVIRGEDDLFLRDLIQLHPECVGKTGVGVKSFTIQVDPIWKTTRHFVLTRNDGSVTDFSFISCLDGAHRIKDALSALRQAVSDQIIFFKRSAFSSDILPICPYLGLALNFEDAHVDHTSPYTFQYLVNCWLAESQLSLPEIQLSDSVDNQWTSYMADRAQEKSWAEFHRSRAILRVISKSANLSNAKHRTPNPDIT